MALSWTLAGLVFTLVLLGLLLLVARWLDRRSWPAWDLTLSDDEAAQYRWIEDDAEAYLDGLDAALSLACAERESGNPREAARILGAAVAFLESYVPTLGARLDKWSLLSRGVPALLLVPPLRPSRFRSHRLQGLAVLQRACDLALVSSGERFRLRAYVLLLALGLVLRTFRSAARRAASRPRSAGRALRRAQAARADLETLGREALALLRALLVSLRAAGNTRAA